MAGGKGGTFANQLLKLIFNGVTIPGLADNTVSSPLTVLWVSLHTADPGIGGSQTASEAAYPGYARVSVARTAVGWVVTGAVVDPAASITWPVATGGSEVEAFWAVGEAASGASEVLYRGPITPTVTVSAGIAPILTAATAITEA